VSESVVSTWNDASIEVSLKVLSLNIELLREIMPHCTHALVAEKYTVREFTFSGEFSDGGCVHLCCNLTSA